MLLSFFMIKSVFILSFLYSEDNNNDCFLSLYLISRSGGGSRLQSTMSLGTMRHHNHSKYLHNIAGNNSYENSGSRTLRHQSHQNRDKTYGFFREVSQTSPRKNNHNLSTLRLLRGNNTGGSGGGRNGSASSTVPTSSQTMRPTSSSMSSYTISGSCSSSNSNNSNGTSSSNSNNAYGFANFNHIGTLASGKQRVYCSALQ